MGSQWLVPRDPAWPGGPGIRPGPVTWCCPGERAFCRACNKASLMFSRCVFWSLGRVLLLVTPMDCSPPGSSVRGDSPGKNTGMGCHAFLQGIFPTQRSNLGLPHCGGRFCIAEQPWKPPVLFKVTLLTVSFLLKTLCPC